MPTECSPDFFGFEPVEGRAVVAAFDAGAVTSDAGALLLGATDRAIRMMDRLASCFHDVRCPELIEHQVVTLVGQRVFGIALGYEDRCWQAGPILPVLKRGTALKPRHFLGVRLAVMTMSWISSSDTLSMSI